jgi:hypothetical protein
LPFRSVYLTHDEWAAELANRTVHGVMHMSWVPDDAGGYRGQMAVLVKPNGLFGRLYMAGIAPFRHLFVYPPLMRDFARGGKPTGPPQAEPDLIDGTYGRQQRCRSCGRGWIQRRRSRSKFRQLLQTDGVVADKNCGALLPRSCSVTVNPFGRPN